MKKTKINNNHICLAGLIDAPVVFTHEMYGEPFFESVIRVPRENRKIDRIPFVISGRVCREKMLSPGMAVRLRGQLRSFNCTEVGKNRLKHYLFTESLDVRPAFRRQSANNDARLDGFICSRPIGKMTFTGNHVTTFLLAVNRPTGFADYISCVCWGRNADYVQQLPVGTHLFVVSGRIQERVCICREGNETGAVHFLDLAVSRLSTMRKMDKSA